MFAAKDKRSIHRESAPGCCAQIGAGIHIVEPAIILSVPFLPRQANQRRPGLGDVEMKDSLVTRAFISAQGPNKTRVWCRHDARQGAVLLRRPFANLKLLPTRCDLSGFVGV